MRRIEISNAKASNECSSNVRLDQLFELNYSLDALDDLQKCSNRWNFETIHFISSDSIIINSKNVLQRLGQMKHVKILHLGEITIRVLNNIDVLPYVQELCTSAKIAGRMTEHKLKKILRCFSNLERII